MRINNSNINANKTPVMKKHLLVFIIAATWLLPGFLQAQDTWTKKTDFGGIGRTGAFGFAIVSKGYIVTG